MIKNLFDLEINGSGISFLSLDHQYRLNFDDSIGYTKLDSWHKDIFENIRTCLVPDSRLHASLLHTFSLEVKGRCVGIDISGLAVFSKKTHDEFIDLLTRIKNNSIFVGKLVKLIMIKNCREVSVFSLCSDTNGLVPEDIRENAFYEITVSLVDR
jgi:hypothetical protein